MPRAPQRGFTIVECMAAMAIMLVGAAGIVSLHTYGVVMNGDARRMTRATAIAQDLMNNIQLWAYNEAGPLAKVSTKNSSDIADTAHAFESDPSPLADGLADHDETTLTALGTSWLGTPQATLGVEYQRYWNVLYVDTNGDGINDVVQIAVIVRWPQGAGWRRVVLQTMKLNPSRD